MTILYMADGRPATIRRDREALGRATTALLAEHRSQTPKGMRKEFRKLTKDERHQRKLARLSELRARPAPLTPAQKREQGVYVVGAPGGAIKIGIAVDVTKRLHGIQNGHPERLKVYYFSGILPPGTAREIERQCHQLLIGQRLSGEWFSAEWREAVALVKSLIPIAPPEQ